MKTKHRYRSIFISDIHLGTRDAKNTFLKNFLENIECDCLYLVGDIFDLWKLKNGWHWPQVNNDILRLVFLMAQNGTRVTYIPGNHDEMFRAYTGNCFNGVYVEQEALHHSANGRSYLVIHGDEFDYIMRHNRWLAHIGDNAYDFLLWLNHWLNVVRRRLGYDYWSLSAFLKQHTKGAVNFIGNFEKLVCYEAERRGVTGIICGHIHHASIQKFGNIEYKNSGDWVESCTALAEHEDGSFELLHWTSEGASLIKEATAETAILSRPARKAA